MSVVSPIRCRERPRPRKGGITQQMKNNKRQRATPDQLKVLISEFQKVPIPSAERRRQIGDAIDMTERSVQIWFQNKRAKMKQATKQRECLLTGHFCNNNVSGYLDIVSPDVSSSPSSIAHVLDTAAIFASSRWPEANPIDLHFVDIAIGQWKASDNCDAFSAVYLPATGELQYTFQLIHTNGELREVIVKISFDDVSCVSLLPQSHNSSMGIVTVALSGMPIVSPGINSGEPNSTFNGLVQELVIAAAQPLHILEGHLSDLYQQLRLLYIYQPAKIDPVLKTFYESDPLHQSRISNDFDECISRWPENKTQPEAHETGTISPGQGGDMRIDGMSEDETLALYQALVVNNDADDSLQNFSQSDDLLGIISHSSDNELTDFPPLSEDNDDIQKHGNHMSISSIGSESLWDEVTSTVPSQSLIADKITKPMDGFLTISMEDNIDCRNEDDGSILTLAYEVLGDLRTHLMHKETQSEEL